MEHRAQHLKISGAGLPEVTKLPNSRYRLEFRCVGIGKEDWYYDNIEGRLLTDFGSLMDAEMKIDGLGGSTAIPESVYPDMCLVENNLEYTPSGTLVVLFAYETLTATWTSEDDDRITSTDNGLRLLTRVQVAKGGTALPYDEDDVGVATITDGGKTLYLAGFEDGGSERKGQVVTRWAEAGTLNRSEDKVGSQQAITIQAIGEVPATPAGYSLARTSVGNYEGFQTNDYTFLKPSVLSRSIREQNNGALIIETVEAFNEIPTANTAGAVNIGQDVSNVEGIPTRRYTFAKGDGQIQVSKRPASPSLAGVTEVTVVSYGASVTPTGFLIAESETEEDGYIRYTKTALQGTIIGVKQTYKDVVEVEVPGEVECATQDVSITDLSLGSITGTIAIPKVTPRKTKRIAATVTVEITTTPPNTASLAFDLGEIACSVTSTSENYSSSLGPKWSYTSGAFTFNGTDWSRDYSPSARIQTYPGCYLVSASSSGQVSYQSSRSTIIEGDGSGIDSVDTSNSLSETTCTGSGSTSASGYSETGVIRRNSRPILVTIDGTVYYEVITWSV